MNSCFQCHGNGSVRINGRYRPCFVCNGTGFVPSSPSNPTLINNAEEGAKEPLTIKDYEEVLQDYDRLVRELDTIINGDNPAKQARLCDLVAQCKNIFPISRATDNDLDRLKAMFENEEPIVLLSNLVWGYHNWANDLPVPKHEEEPNNDPMSYFNTDVARSIIEKLLAGATEAQDDWKRVEDGLPDYELTVDVYGVRRLSHPQMGGNPPQVTISRRIDTKGTAMHALRDRYVDKNGFAHMESVTHWRLRPSPPSNDNP